jgi:hypothetical protein
MYSELQKKTAAFATKPLRITTFEAHDRNDFPHSAKYPESSMM